MNVDLTIVTTGVAVIGALAAWFGGCANSAALQRRPRRARPMTNSAGWLLRGARSSRAPRACRADTAEVSRRGQADRLVNRVHNSLTASEIRRSPYPQHLVEPIQLPDAGLVVVRPICRGDLLRERAFLAALSPETRYRRFMSAHKLRPGELRRLTDIDYHRELALVAVMRVAGVERFLGVARYVRDEREPKRAEFAIVIDDHRQGQGLGEKLLKSLMRAAVQSGVEVLIGITLSSNRAMLSLARRVGFEAHRCEGDATVMDLHLRLDRRD